jgi:excinuclease UvrABC nuclease subunit
MLEHEMTAASADLAFERAAALRDKLDTLTWLSERLRLVREASRHSFIYPVRGHDDAELWYLIQGGRVCAVVPVPTDEASRCQATKRIKEIYKRHLPASGLPDPREIDGVFLVTAWFGRHKEELGITRRPAAALEKMLSSCEIPT